jgi:hypothetical protein
MLKNENEKNIKYNKKYKKDWGELVLIFETYDPDHEFETNPIKTNPKNNDVKSSIIK